MHDVVPANFSLTARQYLHFVYQSHWIDRVGTQPWPLRASDLIPAHVHKNIFRFSIPPSTSLEFINS